MQHLLFKSRTALTGGLAFLFEEGVIMARAINNRSQIVGNSQIDPGSAIDNPFLWQNGEMTDFGTLIEPNFAHSSAYGINSSGIALGYSSSHATLWKDGDKRDLGSLGGRRSSLFRKMI